MCRDYSYEYRWDQKYCYPNSSVLINKLNIRNAASLVVAEREITSLKLAASKADPIKGRLDFVHLQNIHRYIFGDIYSWAGELRQVDISKGNQFCLCQHLQTYGEKVFSDLEAEHFLIYSSDVPHRLAYYLSEINVLHPFREGNGRTQRLFIEYLANVAGYSVDFSEVTPREMIVASAESFARRYEGIYALFERITAPISELEQRWAVDFFLGEGSEIGASFKSELL